MKINFVKSPNLPKNEVKDLIMSDAVPELTKVLISRGINVIHPEDSNALQKPISCHADMLSLHLGGNRIAIASGQGRLTLELLEIGMEIIWAETLDAKYPDDCRLNALILGNTILANNCSNNIKRYASDRNLTIIEVKQGYTRCSTCVVSENAIVTSDATIERAAKSAGIDVLLVPPGEIELEGYDYGFIGGACTKLSATELALTGKASALSYYDQLEEFCLFHGVTITELTNLPLFDIGGLVQIKESAS